MSLPITNPRVVIHESAKLSRILGFLSEVQGVTPGEVPPALIMSEGPKMVILRATPRCIIYAATNEPATA